MSTPLIPGEPGSAAIQPDPEQFADRRLIPAAAAPHALGAAQVQTGSLADTILAKDELGTYEANKRKQILGFRRWLVPSLFGLTIGWLIFVGIIISIEERRHHLSDAVLIALLGTATANVLGLLVIVLKSLFPLELERSGE